jgi:enoyl-[acyl-carrier protein] reductase I
MLKIDLSGKRAFVAGVGDDQGYGWAIAWALAAAGATIYLGTWTPILKIFTMALQSGKFDESRRLPNGKLMEFAAVYPLDAVFDTMEDVPQEIQENKRYKDVRGYSIAEVTRSLQNDAGGVDLFVHSLANAPEVKKPLLETSRDGYLAAVSMSTYSFVSFLQRLGPLFGPEGSAVTLSYLAAERVIPGYGGGMSSAKAALESDVRTLAFEAGRKYGIRINGISAGPLPSRAARAIGMIEAMVEYARLNSPRQREMAAEEVGYAAAFLLSPLASAITGETLHVDHGYHAMGMATAAPALAASERVAS